MTDVYYLLKLGLETRGLKVHPLRSDLEVSKVTAKVSTCVRQLELCEFSDRAILWLNELLTDL